MRSALFCFALILGLFFLAPLRAQEAVTGTVVQEEVNAAAEPAVPEGTDMEALPAEGAPAAQAAPKVIPPVPGEPVEIRTAAEIAAAQLDFLRSFAESKDDDVVEAGLLRVTDWLRAYPEGEKADEALLLKANLHLKLGDYKGAVICLLRHSQEFPDSQLKDNARLLLNNTIDRKLSKKLKTPLNELADSGSGQDKSARLAAMLSAAGELLGKDFYEPLLGEMKDYLVRFPVSPRRDAVQLAMGALFSEERESVAAKLAYEELVQVYPSSLLMAAAKRSLADVLAEDLKDYFGAIKVYLDVAESFPGTDEAWVAYEQLPRLTERQKQYDKAVEVYESIIKLYPDKPEARNAYKSEARILREELKKPAEAIAVLNRLADKYKDDKVVDELYLAAEIARKDLKDLGEEIKAYDRIAEDYSGTKDAPKAMIEAGQAYEKAKDTDKAKEYYNKVVEKYPDDSYAKKAQKYVEALLKG